MATIKNTYTGNGTTVVYSLTFPYLRQEHVKVTVNGTLTTAYTFVNSNTIQFNTAPANGAAIVIYRETESDELDNRFFANSSIRAGSLNNNFTQALYVAQETQDTAAVATSRADSAIASAAAAVSTANSANITALGAVISANSAINTANNAVLTANSAVNTANAASSAAGNAVSTANGAVSTANSALSTANAASSAASSAVSTANAAQSAANTASSNATAAVSTANTANSNASAALSAANSATSTANTALSTANAAVSTANTANATANNANATAASAVALANAAQAAVAAVAIGTPVVNVAALVAISPAPANGDLFEVINSTGIQSSSAVTGVPGGFTGSNALSVTVSYNTSTSKYAYVSYRTLDPEARYATKATETTASTALSNANNALTQLLSAVFTTDPRLSDQRVPTDGSVTNAKVATNAAIALSKLATITAGSVILGNASGVPTATTLSGDVTVSSTGVTSIGSGVIVDADINGSAGIAYSKLASMLSGRILLGNSSNVPTPTIVSGDVLISDTGVTSIATAAIVDADVNASAAIAGTKISPNFGSQNVQTTGQFIGALNGNANTATTLLTARTINGVPFNGSANITLTANTPTNLIPGAFILGSSFNGGTERTWSVNASTNATANTVAARDGNGFCGFGVIELTGTNDTPLLIQNTSAPANTRRVWSGVSSLGSWVHRSFNDAGVLISTDYEITRGTSGATAHVWRCLDVERARVQDNGLFVSTTTASPGAGNTATGFHVRSDGRTCFSTDGSNAHVVNRNVGSRADQPLQQININGSSVLSIRDYGAGAGVGLVAQSTNNLNIEGAQVRSDTVRGQTTSSSANIFIDAGTGQFLRSTSSLKYKRDVEDIDTSYSFNILEQSRPVWFRSSIDTDHPDWGHWGLIAEEVAEYDPRLVHYGQLEDGTLEPEGVQYDRIIPHLLVILKQQQSDILELQAKVEQLQQAQSQPES